jgi:hypothetical protein
MVPTMLNGFPTWAKHAYQKVHRLAWMANGAIEKLWPINRIASNLMIVARKPKSGGTNDPGPRAS